MTLTNMMATLDPLSGVGARTDDAYPPAAVAEAALALANPHLKHGLATEERRVREGK